MVGDEGGLLIVVMVVTMTVVMTLRVVVVAMLMMMVMSMATMVAVTVVLVVTPSGGGDKEEAIIVLVELLGVEYKDAFDETKKIRGEQFSLSWLQGAYEEMCEEERWDEAAKAYLFHLVGCTLFANKNATYVEVKFLDFL